MISTQELKCDIKDINLAEQGKINIEWALRNMPVLQKIKEMNLPKEVLRSLDFRQLIGEIYNKYFFIPQKIENEPLYEDILIQKMILNYTNLIPNEFYYLTTIDNATTWQYCNKFNSNMAEYFNKNVWEE